MLTRLHNSGKFEIAELANYAVVNDPRAADIPWKIYPNHIAPNDPRADIFSKGQNIFGAWRFERTCLDFRPDFVSQFLDPWMCLYVCKSPYRPYFSQIYMPTVDSEPQKDEWLYDYTTIDKVLTYTDWGKEVLDRTACRHINTFSSAPPGTDLEVYNPVLNKIEHKRKFGFTGKECIIGTTMRNQRRKLFPDLLTAFNLFIKKCKEQGKEELVKNTFLYFHTSYPDQGWQIPVLLKETGLTSKVYFTYLCRNCNNWFPSLFNDARSVCPRCNTLAGVLPSVACGLSTKQLSEVYNLFDLYIQPAVSEGFGIPVVEAASCGVPVCGTDVTALVDVVRKLNGIPIKLDRVFRTDTEDAWRGYPSLDHMSEIFLKFSGMPLEERRKRGELARKGVEKHYTWENTANIWTDVLENTELKGFQGQWDAPPNIFEPSQENPPSNLNNDDFVTWCILNILGDASLLDSYFALNIIHYLNYEIIAGPGQHPTPYTRQNALDTFRSMAQNKKHCEMARCGMLPLIQEDWLKWANERIGIRYGS